MYMNVTQGIRPYMYVLCHKVPPLQSTRNLHPNLYPASPNIIDFY